MLSNSLEMCTLEKVVVGSEKLLVCPQPPPRIKKIARLSQLTLDQDKTRDTKVNELPYLEELRNDTEQRTIENSPNPNTCDSSKQISNDIYQQKNPKPVAKPRTKNRMAQDQKTVTESEPLEHTDTIPPEPEDNLFQNTYNTFEGFLGESQSAPKQFENDACHKRSCSDSQSSNESVFDGDLSEFDPLKRTTLYFDLLKIINPNNQIPCSDGDSMGQAFPCLDPWPYSDIQRISDSGALTFPDNFSPFDSDFSTNTDPFENTHFSSECQTFNTSISETSVSSPSKKGSTSSETPISYQNDESEDIESGTRVLQRRNSVIKSAKNSDSHSFFSRIPQRSGYLLKQGGQNSNRGWRKRWVVFNGTSLRYFMESSSPVSIRIIPIKCMEKVEVDIKPTDRDSFRFKLYTNIKKRVFLFSSEKSDNCIQWALSLGAAITQYQKYGWFQNDLGKPDQEGFIRINSKKYYTTIMDQKLTFYDSIEDYGYGSPSHEIELNLASIKKVVDEKKFKLKLSTNKTFFDLMFEDQEDLQRWTTALDTAIHKSLSDDTVLKKVQENESNSRCADCSSETAYWASVILGIVLCDNCAGIHRTFNLKQSKIRSLRMDVNVWTPSLIDFMIQIGNANANAFWEYSLPSGRKIQPSSTIDERKIFLTEKYMTKKFCEPFDSGVSEEKLASDLLTLSKSADVIGVMKLLFSHDNLPQEHISASYEAAKENGKGLVAEFLFQNGGDRQHLDNSYNEKLEEIKLTGFLKKTGPQGRPLKRWCVLNHGALMYYTNEKGSKCKGLIQRNDILMVRVKDAHGLQFEISTKMKDNRVFTFTSERKEDVLRWVQVLTKTLIATSAWDKVDTNDIHVSGLGQTQEASGEEWLDSFLVLSQSSLLRIRPNQEIDALSLSKVHNISCVAGIQNQDKYVAISTSEKTFHIKAKLQRDTEKLSEVLSTLCRNRPIDS
ncbi:arf-GAP with Rho-GAP domain ANK repeat and PH domain-containing protein 2 [Biomphalaria pfeifferi]|uniref:Arf-GAP with Rho-GAP domain ANK repeat and PH domain-containing protein 2 n=1 Tax=Biomphalaria pfeifferi TaxID=112525 RepID=A0AAD8C4T8_BIOPF|nr:arf-GAP with Rho-GAP domain ANK repeat and PH domain-containing protein 2 [Biomphalaria pfeifferi]